tara:strand:- start:2173 stop:3015 length:843 start_codon:yes stop_codon:yes gene_type:complete
MKPVIDKIMNAVSKLKGDLGNVATPLYTDKYLYWCNESFFECLSFSDDISWELICSCEEFLATVAECETNFGKCNQSYSGYKSNFKGVHTDRLIVIQPTKDLDKELDMDIDLVMGRTYEFSDDKNDWEEGELYDYSDEPVQAVQYQSKSGSKTEWYQYIREIKPQPTKINIEGKDHLTGVKGNVNKAYTQEMADNGVQVEAGMRFATEAGEYIAEYTNKKSVVFTDENGFLVTVTRGHAKPIDTRTGKEKAIDDISNEFLKGGNTFRSVLEAAYDKWVGE